METTFDKYPKVRDEFIRNWNNEFTKSFRDMSAMTVLLPSAIYDGSIDPDLANEMIFLLDIYFESHKDKIKDITRKGVNKSLNRKG